MQIPRVVLDGLQALTSFDSECSDLKVCVPRQEDDLWCWAAVAVGVAHYYGSTGAQQHTIASAVLGLCCLPNGANPDCSCTAYLQDALSVHDNFDGLVPTEFAAIRDAICSGRPLCTRMVDGQTAHFVVVYGFDDYSYDVSVVDPEGFCWTGPYEDFRYRYRGVYEWKAAYATEKPAAGPAALSKGITLCP